MFSQSVTGIMDDPALPALAQALDTERMLPVIAEVAGLHPQDTAGLICDVQLLNHKLGRRCTVRYTLTRAGAEGRPVNLASVVGKVYDRPESAERLYRRIEGLRSGPFNGAPSCIPAPMMLVQDLGLVLQEYVDGSDLRHALSSANTEAPWALAGHWLARLHLAPRLAGLRTASLEHELETADRWCAHIAPHLGTADAGRLRRVLEARHRLADEAPPHEPVMIHKDFYYGNVLWDGPRVWVLDFDELSIGDPALDVGHFLAHLETLACRTTGRADAFTQESASFLGSYREETSLDLESRLPFYKAYTFVKLAATEVSRKQSQWEQMARLLADLACQAMDVQFGRGSRARAAKKGCRVS